MKHQPCPPCPTLPAISGQGAPQPCPAPIGGKVVLGPSEDQLFATPTKLSGQGARLPRLNDYELERNTARRRAATKTICRQCGTPTWTGPDDTPSGPQTKTVTLDRGRLTRLGMYQAATSGRQIYTLRHTKTGPSIDWLGEVAQPKPERDHLLVAHGCGLPNLDTFPAPAAADIDGIPPF